MARPRHLRLLGLLGAFVMSATAGEQIYFAVECADENSKRTERFSDLAAQA